MPKTEAVYTKYIQLRARPKDRERLERLTKSMGMSASKAIRSLLRFIDRNPDFVRLIKDGR